ncbi:MAG: hypothetical protein ABIK93_10475 [candidate division WOR-3 bacterium]
MMLNRTNRIILILISIPIAFWLGCAQKKTEKIKKGPHPLKLSDLPKPVRVTVEKLTMGGVIKKIDKEIEEGRLIFDIEARVNNKDVEYDIAENGTIITWEESIPLDSLPEAVRMAVENYFVTTQGLKAHREIEKNVTFYEVEGKKDGQKVTLKLSEAGQILETE